MTRSRRAVLRSGAGALALGAFAGCLDEPPADGGSEGTVYGAFFALADWTSHVVGDEMTVENPVETGEMGHGWEPPSDLQREISQSAAFVYLDTPEFAWAQDVAADLESEDVAVIDALEGIEGQLGSTEHETDHGHEPEAEYDGDPTAVEVGGFALYDGRSGEEVASLHDGHWHGDVPDVPLDGSVTLEGVVEDVEGRRLPLGGDAPFALEATVPDGANADVLEIESDGDRLELRGLEEGRTTVVFELAADGEVVWDTSGADGEVAVVDERADEGGLELADPHVWVDPVLARSMVETIAAGLGELDPDGADQYEENAAEYAGRLDEVHQRFQNVAEAATRDVAVLAGHDSFGYLEDRYEFELRTPVGVSPDAVESSEDVSELIGAIEDNGIETILYDPFESSDGDLPQMAEVLLEETDATEAAPITAAGGTLEEWNEQGYGWIEQMEEITIPSLAAALGAE